MKPRSSVRLRHRTSGSGRAAPPPLVTSPEPTTEGSSYAAFISYSHQLDGRLATVLQSSLHRFAKPWYRLRAVRVFRDDAVLSANPGLWSAIKDALAASEYLILLASPSAARSEWVARELEYWRLHKSLDRLLIVLTDGDLVWDPAAGDFDWHRTTALPLSAHGAFREEPRYIDLRWARREHLSLAHPAFRDCVASLAAPLHHRPKDALVGDDVRQHRRTVYLVRSVISFLSALVILSSALAVVATQQRNDARIQRNRAENQARIATSRLLATQAVANLRNRPTLALLQALKGLQVADTAEARSSLLAVLQSQPQLAAVLPGDTPASSVAFSPDGRLLAIGDSDGRIKLWDIGRRQRLASLAGRGLVTRLLFSPDGSRLASANNGEIVPDNGGWASTYPGMTLWDLRSRRPPRRLTVEREVLGMAFDRGADALIAVDAAGTMIRWTFSGSRAPRRSRASSNNNLSAVAFSRDGRSLAVASDDVELLGRQQSSPAHLTRRRSLARISCVAFSPDARVLAAGDYGGSITLWDARVGRRLGVLNGHSRAVHGIAFSPNGKLLASAGEDGKSVLWDVDRRALLGRPLKLRSEAVLENPAESVAFAPEGQVFASAMSDGTAVLWRVKRVEFPGRSVKAPSRIVRSLAAGADQPVVASGSDDDRIVLWDAQRQQPLATLRSRLGGRELNDDTFTPGELSFSPDGTRLVAGDTVVPIVSWDVVHRRSLGPLPESRGFPWVAFTPDGTSIVGLDSKVVGTLGADTATLLRTWEADTGTVSATVTVPEAHAMGLSPDGRTVALGGINGSLMLVDVGRMKIVATLRGPVQSIQAVAFSPDGSTVASASGDGNIILWSVRSKQRLATLGGHTGQIQDIAFSPDGHTLASGGSDGKVILWDVDHRQVSATLDAGDPVLSVAYLGANTLVSGTFNATVTFWNLDVEQWQQRACDIVAGVARGGDYRFALDAGPPTCR